jgi:RNase P subunit RPR2
LLKGTVEEFERIRKDIEKSETQTTTIHGNVVDAIKPAINVKISGALPSFTNKSCRELLLPVATSQAGFSGRCLVERCSCCGLSTGSKAMVA